MGVPVEVSWKPKTVPTRAPGAILELVMTGAVAAELITIFNGTVVVPPAFVAESVTAKEPTWVGVPAITPVPAVKASPVGSAVVGFTNASA